MSRRLRSLALLALAGSGCGSCGAAAPAGGGARPEAEAHGALQARGSAELASTRRPPGAAAECVGRDGAMRLRGGFKSNTDRWRECGYNLQPDFRSTANQEVPLNTKLGDAAECGDPDAIKELLQVRGDTNCRSPSCIAPFCAEPLTKCRPLTKPAYQAHVPSTLPKHTYPALLVGGRH